MFSPDAQYEVATQAAKAREYGLEWIVITDHGGPAHQKLSVDLITPQIEESRRANRDLLIYQGLEWNIPGAEHATVFLPPGRATVDILKAFEAAYDGGVLADREVIARPTSGDGEPYALEALRYLDAQVLSGRAEIALMFANHPARRGVDSPHEIRGWRDTAPRVAVGMEGAPGHQAAGIPRRRAGPAPAVASTRRRPERTASPVATPPPPRTPTFEVGAPQSGRFRFSHTFTGVERAFYLRPRGSDGNRLDAAGNPVMDVPGDAPPFEDLCFSADPVFVDVVRPMARWLGAVAAPSAVHDPHLVDAVDRALLGTGTRAERIHTHVDRTAMVSAAVVSVLLDTELPAGTAAQVCARLATALDGPVAAFDADRAPVASVGDHLDAPAGAARDARSGVDGRCVRFPEQEQVTGTHTVRDLLAPGSAPGWASGCRWPRPTWSRLPASSARTWRTAGWCCWSSRSRGARLRPVEMESPHQCCGGVHG